jgi:hypothetical protein
VADSDPFGSVRRRLDAARDEAGDVAVAGGAVFERIRSAGRLVAS